MWTIPHGPSAFETALGTENNALFDAIAIFLVSISDLGKNSEACYHHSTFLLSIYY